MFALLCRNFGSVAGPKLFRRDLSGRPLSRRPDFQLNEIRVLVSVAAAVAIAGACSRGSSHDGCAHIGVGLHGSAYLIDFIDCQLTSTFPRKHSVVFLSRHVFSPFYFCYIRLPALLLRFTDKMCLRLSRLLASA
jgi:hypothetical protein